LYKLIVDDDCGRGNDDEKDEDDGDNKKATLLHGDSTTLQ